MAKEEKVNEFGLTTEEIEKVKDIKPGFDWKALNKQGDSVKFQILSDKPYKLEWEDKTTKEKKSSLAIDVIDLATGLEVMAWLSSKSLRMGFYNLSTKVGSLKDVFVVVSLRHYDHPEYGQTRGYVVQQFEPVIDGEAN